MVGWKRIKELPRHPRSLPALFERGNMKEQERNNNRSMQRSTQHSQRQEPMSNKKKVLKVLAWFFIRWRPFYRGCNGGEMNWIVICYSEPLFWMGTFIVERLLRGGHFVLFLNMPPKGPTASRSRSRVSGAERDRCDTEDGVHHKHRAWPHTGGVWNSNPPKSRGECHIMMNLVLITKRGCVRDAIFFRVGRN